MRDYLSRGYKRYKTMLNLAYQAFKNDQNAELKYCIKCHIIADTRAGARLHKNCPKTLTSKQIFGRLFLLEDQTLRYKGDCGLIHSSSACIIC